MLAQSSNAVIMRYPYQALLTGALEDQTHDGLWVSQYPHGRPFPLQSALQPTWPTPCSDPSGSSWHIPLLLYLFLSGGCYARNSCSCGCRVQSRRGCARCDGHEDGDRIRPDCCHGAAYAGRHDGYARCGRHIAVRGAWTYKYYRDGRPGADINPYGLACEVSAKEDYDYSDDAVVKKRRTKC